MLRHLSTRASLIDSAFVIGLSICIVLLSLISSVGIVLSPAQGYMATGRALGHHLSTKIGCGSTVWLGTRSPYRYILTCKPENEFVQSPSATHSPPRDLLSPHTWDSPVNRLQGVESMSLTSMGGAMPAGIDPKFIASDREGAAVLIPMGITSENVAGKFGVSREEQDAFAAESHTRAQRAQEEGLFDEEILPVRVRGSRDFHVEPVVMRHILRFELGDGSLCIIVVTGLRHWDGLMR